MNKSAIDTVLEICLQHSMELPSHKRVALYRGLAELCTDKTQSAELRRAALELESADKRCREFSFVLTNR